MMFLAHGLTKVLIFTLPGTAQFFANEPPGPWGPLCGPTSTVFSTKNIHETMHFHVTQHPIMRCIEPGEDWYRCYLDEVIPSQ